MISNNKGKTLLISVILSLPLIIFLGCLKAESPLGYENKAMGIGLSGPRSWFIISPDNLRQVTSEVATTKPINENIKKIGVLVVFTKFPFGSQKDFNPNISFITEEISSEGSIGLKSPLDYAEASVEELKKDARNFKLIKDPSIVIVNGREGSNFIYEGRQTKDNLQIKLRGSVYLFIKDNIIYVLQFIDKVIDFGENLKDFEYCVNTLKLK